VRTGVFVHSTGSPDTFKLTDQTGLEVTFFGFNTADADHKGQLWKITDPAANTAYVGSTSSASAAISTGYDSDGRITLAYDTAGRSYAYSYSSSTIGSYKRLETVVVTASSVEVARVAYGYYPDSPSIAYGEPGDLRTATVTLPLTDSGINDIRVQHYRYWEGAYNASTNPGYPHAIQLVVQAEGARRYEFQDSTFDDDILSETTANLRSFGSAYFEYDTSRRISEAAFNGDCGCGGAGSGTFTFRYETNGAHPSASGYDEEWQNRTTVQRPDGTWLTQYFDEIGQSLSQVITAGDPSSSPGSTWVTGVTRSSVGCVTEIGTPASVSSYTHDSGSPSAPDGTVALSSSVGLVKLYTRTGSGSFTGFLIIEKFREAGTGSTSYVERQIGYDSLSKTVGAATLLRPVVDEDERYELKQTTPSIGSGMISLVTTTAASSPNTLSNAKVARTIEAVDTAENGANATVEESSHVTLAGNVDFQKARDGKITYREYTNGLLTKDVDDADTTSLSPPTGFSHTGTPASLETLHTYDSQGRRTLTTLPDGRVTQQYYTILKDRRRVTLSFTKYVSGSGDRYGPVGYTVTNHAGKVEASGVIALTSNVSSSALTGYIDETDADPISAVDVGTVAQLRVSRFDDTGTRVDEERAYFAIPSSLPGTDGTHYDATLYGYDDMGRRRRTKEAHGTITRSVFDTRGNPIERWVGTNDNGLAGGESSGTANMVKVDETTFDGGSAGGNGYVTKRTLFIQDNTTGQRETTYYNDARGRVIAVVNPTAPHTVNAYDNLGRVTATAQYSSSSGLSASSAPTTTTNRVALRETAYDDRGQAWKTIRHNIDPSDGSSDDTLESLTWFNTAGRTLKRDGEQLEKFAYDRHGRQTHHFVLAVDNDSAYADVDDVAGDIVLEERQTTFDDDGHEIMSATISRFYSDRTATPTTGALDTNADSDRLMYTAANVLGRIQITATWYDEFDRTQDVVLYGTNHATDNVATFDRDGLSVPSRSGTALRTTYSYNTDGTLKDVTDPKGIVTRTEYDALGRRTKVLANYTDGTPGGGTNGDEDQTVAYGYTDGLQTSITADLPSPETDQVTTYFYGTQKGTPSASKLATGHLLRAVKYPDSTNAGTTTAYIDGTSDADVVSHSYNAQGQETRRKDQSGNVLESDYDLSGRLIARKATTIDADFDDEVQLIQTTYDSLGRRESVTQRASTSVDGSGIANGTIIDQVKYLYDGWGNVTNFRQDLDSAVGGSGYREVAYTYAKATNGRNTIRRADMTLPDGTTFDYFYRGGNWHDEEASRVTTIKDAYDVDIVNYDYNGVGQVVRTQYDEVDVFSKAYNGTGTTFSALDRFDRTIVSRWTKALATNRNFYKVDVGYDENSTITYQDDGVHDGHDVLYTNDDLGRLIGAEEGTLTGGPPPTSITSRTRNQIWGLNQTGNWNTNLVDLDGDNNGTDPGELDETRTHNAVNELGARDIDSDSSDDYSLAYDEVGNMIDDGEDYENVWDVFGRLRAVYVRNTSPAKSDLVSEYRYNGLGYLVARHQDTDTDSDVDGSDVIFETVFDERWRAVATYRSGDSDPKELFLHHAAGASGFGGSSYIDHMVLRNRDATNGWAGATDGTLEDRIYYCQNWRADVVALIDDAGGMLEWVKYSAYGVPFGLPAKDADSDGDYDSADDTAISGWGAYDVRGDVNLDGVVDGGDTATMVSLGRGVLTSISISNPIGYAGQVGDAKLSAKWHIRHRVLDASLGGWASRDPLGYADGQNVLEYSRGAPVGKIDTYGLSSASAPTVIPCPGSHVEMAKSGTFKHCWDAAVGDPMPTKAEQQNAEVWSRSGDAECSSSHPGSLPECACHFNYYALNYRHRCTLPKWEFGTKTKTISTPWGPVTVSTSWYSYMCMECDYDFDAVWLCITPCEPQQGPVVASLGSSSGSPRPLGR
jgi:RHS repeat-associated protein